MKRGPQENIYALLHKKRMGHSGTGLGNKKRQARMSVFVKFSCFFLEIICIYREKYTYKVGDCSLKLVPFGTGGISHPWFWKIQAKKRGYDATGISSS